MSSGASQSDILFAGRDSGEGNAAGAPPEAWDWDRLDAALRPRLVAVGVRRFGCTPEEAEDLVQDIFETVLLKRPRVRNAEGYLVTMFFNRCLDRAEQRARQMRLETSLGAGFAGPDSSERLLTAFHVRGAFRRMTPVCRQLIRSYCVLRVSLAEAAAHSGCSVPAVWKRISQCIKRMRTCLAA
ncbi:MAG: sigma-70 family RNA polymerase sigma factor [Thermoanaerobaculia bacterium]|jgi:RNA polymerase sigma factor (sigma-70 family)